MTTFRDLIESDDELAIFLDAVDGFGQVIEVGGQSIAALIQDDFDEVDPRSPRALCMESDLDGIEHGAAVVIDGSNYWLEGWQPTGDGLVNLILRASL